MAGESDCTATAAYDDKTHLVALEPVVVDDNDGTRQSDLVLHDDGT